MECVSFYRRPRARLRASAVAVALPVVMALACPTPATAADWKDMEISPGHTLSLDSAPGRTFSVKGDGAGPLPAGWSVITQKGALRITAPATATPNEFATVQVTDGGKTETFRVTVDDDDEGGADGDGDHPSNADAPATSSNASAWLERLAGRVASLFGA